MSAVAAPPELLTAEQFGSRPDLGLYTELVKGEVIDVPSPSYNHGKICFKVAFALGMHVVPRELGEIVTNDSGIVTERNPDSTRGADVAYFSYQRLPKGSSPRMYPDVSPELMFEVMSPDEVFRDLMAKVDEYLAAGVSLVYVIDPSREQVALFEKGKLGTFFRGTDDMTFPGVFPDLRIPVGPLFG